MGKRIAVFLILISIACCAFAAFYGNAKIGYEYDFQTEDHGIVNSDRMRYSFRFTYNTIDVDSKGEGNLYAEIAASAEMYTRKRTSSSRIRTQASLEITKANIVAGNWTIDILGPKSSYNFAGCFASLEGGAGKANSYEIETHGFIAKYKDFSVAFSYYHTEKPKLDNSKDDLYVGMETPAFNISNGLTFQAGANFKYDTFSNDSFEINAGGGFRFRYEKEESPFSASVSADGAIINMEFIDETLFPVDISTRIGYGPISTELYFGTSDKFLRDANAFAARVVLDYDVTDSFNISAHADAIYEVVSSFDKVILCFGATLEYSSEVFTIYGSSTVSLHRNAEDGFDMKPWETIDDEGRIEKYAGLGVEAGISSDAIIDNATVALDFKGADYSPGNGECQNLGKVTASVTIEF